jgi:hypothetical protein
VLAQLLIKRDLEQRSVVESVEDQPLPDHRAEGLNAA